MTYNTQRALELLRIGSGRADVVGVSHRPDSGNKGGSFDFYRVDEESRTLSLINRVTLSSLGKTDGERTMLAGGAAGFLLLGELVNLVTALVLGEQPQVAKLRAFRAYGADLRERLGNP